MSVYRSEYLPSPEIGQVSRECDSEEKEGAQPTVEWAEVAKKLVMGRRPFNEYNILPSAISHLIAPTSNQR